MQQQKEKHPISLYCIAAPADQKLLAQWETHLLPLRQTGILSYWSEWHMQAGDDRTKQNTAHLAQADCLVVLLSADFFADDSCLVLMHEALLRQKEDHLRIIPLLVRPVEWQESALGVFSCLPSNGIAITTWEYPDAGWQQAVQGLRRMLNLVSPHTIVTPNKRGTTDQERMIRLLRRTYQATLDGSLRGIAWIDLGLEEHSNAVLNATHLLQRLPDQSEHVLSDDTSILDTYDLAEEALLILGDPGAGKSTLLLDLALRLLVRAETNGTHPLPVILPISSWAVREPELSEWMVEQLARIYDVPRKLGQQWVNQDQILPLLDGLDEIEEAARPLCISAINKYRKEHLAPLVVCSRSAEYGAASTYQRLLLQNAVVVQPLTKTQVELIIQQGGEALAALREVLRDNQELRNLAATPLMLSVLALSYHDTAVNDLPQQQVTLEHRIWTDYVERMVREKGAERLDRGDIPSKRYTLEQTRSWLGWLAQQMQAHNQTLFYGEQLLEDWLPASLQQEVGKLLVCLPTIIMGAMTCIFFDLFLFPGDPWSSLCRRGLIGGFLSWWLCESSSKKTQSFWYRGWKRFLSAGALAILVAVSFGLQLDGKTYFPGNWLQEGLFVGTSLFLCGWLLQLIFTRIARSPSPNFVRSVAYWLGLLPESLRQAGWTGIILGIGLSLAVVLLGDMSQGLGYMLSLGVVFGGALYLISTVLEKQTGKVLLAERVKWTWHGVLRFQIFLSSLSVAFAYFGLYFLFYILSYAAFDYTYNSSLEITFSLGMDFALAGALSGGLIIGLSYWILTGLYQGLSQEHLEEKDRRCWNQGLSHSLRNSFFLSVLSAGVITGIGIISSELNDILGFDLSYGVNDGLNLSLNHWQLLLLLCSWFVVWTAVGGLTIMRHYILRLLLACSHTFPLQIHCFLDDACARVLMRRVGGGYGFVHRRLLEYFAEQDTVNVKQEE